jgi:Tol biopolymer transport system component
MEVPITRTPRSYSAPRLSADGHRVLVVANGDLWLQEIDRDTSTKLTTGATRDNDSPAWSRDEGRAIFRTATGLYSLAVNGSGQLDAIKDTLSTDYPNSISPAGDVLAFTRTSMDTASDVYVLSLQGEPHPHALVKTPGFDGGPQFSPDGRWLLYASNDAGNGEFQVFIRPFAGPDRSWLVAQTGNYPRWSRRGHEIVYRDGPKMMAVDMSTTGVDPVFSAPHVLFEQRYLFGYQTIANYDVSADGERFIMVKSEPGGDRLNVILNWTEELRRLAPEGAR